MHWAPAVFGLFDGRLPTVEQREACLHSHGLEPEQCPALLQTHRYSREVLTQVHHLLSSALPHELGELSLFVLGSVGRFEASAQSDLDLVAITTRASVSNEEKHQRRQAIACLRDAGFDVPEKTFDRVVCLTPGAGHTTALRQIGGRADTNDNLTYRALLLTEGVCVANRRAGQTVLDTLWTAYCRGPITSGRYLGALSNDLHRYYRTICLDYRHKVETGKQWATRSLKLKHSRRLWHLANLVSFCEASTVGDDVREQLLARELGEPPMWRILRSLARMNGPGTQLVEPFEHFLGALAQAEVREQLEALAYDTRTTSEVYTQLYQNAIDLEAAAAHVFEFLWAHCRTHVFRFGVL